MSAAGAGRGAMAQNAKMNASMRRPHTNAIELSRALRIGRRITAAAEWAGLERFRHAQSGTAPALLDSKRFRRRTGFQFEENAAVFRVDAKLVNEVQTQPDAANRHRLN